MNKKLRLATAIIVPSLSVGGFWIYQASLFEKSIAQQFTDMQESLKAYDVSLAYDAFRISKYLFKAHLVNPTISGTMPNLKEYLKDVESLEILGALRGLKGTLLVKGEITACYSPIANAVTIQAKGDSQLDIDGPLEAMFVMPQPKESSFVIQRKDYDFFGKNPFLSLNNIKGISSKSKGFSLLLNDQKLLEIKDVVSQISSDWNEKAIDISVTSDTSQMEFFKIEKVLKGRLAELDLLNTRILSEIEMLTVLGPQDQKISASFHVNDFMSYIEDLKRIYTNSMSKDNAQDFNKLIPEGIRLDINNYSTENKIYQSSMKGSFGRTKDSFPIKLSGEFKVTDQWSIYWNDYLKSMINNLTDAKLSEEFISTLKNEEVSKNIMPQLQSFGKMQFSMDFDIPATLSLTEGKGSLEFKSDLYDFSAVGALMKDGGSIKLSTRNATTLMADLENYVTRASQPFSQIGLQEIHNIMSYIKGSRAVLGKILEPSGALQQALDIHITKEGIKIGTYELAQVLALFGEAMGSLESQTAQAALN